MGVLSCRAQLLALQSAADFPQSSVSRSALYTAALLQHAALLLLMLVSESAVLVLPSDRVPPALLQLLHLLNSVYQALLQQHKQQQQHAATGSSSAFSQLLSAKQQPVQLHIALQVRDVCVLRMQPAVAAPCLLLGRFSLSWWHSALQSYGDGRCGREETSGVTQCPGCMLLSLSHATSLVPCAVQYSSVC